jgi:hypothetical protein
MRNISYQNNDSPYQDYTRTQDDFLPNCSYSTSISDSSSESKVLKELEELKISNMELKRKLSEMDDKLSVLEQTKKIESQMKLPIPINFEELDNFMLNEFSFFLSKAMETTAHWLSQFRSTLLCHLLSYNH